MIAETVRAYNWQNAGKAWAISALTFQDGTAACAACASDMDTEAGTPVFASDDAEGMTCDRCGGAL